ncbi:MAG TPA: glycosyltransferase family 4 protein [Gemmataceae bacterium]|nr:glycosyltransferase family 4 protein [Gemmataceae bacterium]
MSLMEQSSADREHNQRLAARLAVSWAEQRHLSEKLAAIESSTAWAVARRLSQLRRRLCPEGSLRQRCFRLGIRGLRLWRREGTAAVLKKTASKLLGRFNDTPVQSASQEVRLASPALGAGVRTSPGSEKCEFRVAFIGSSAACEAQSMRYRAHNIIQALALVGLEGTFFSLEEVESNLPVILSHDLIILVRLMHNHVTKMVIESARRLGLPIVYDIDDYLFDPWVMPYVEAFRALRQSDGLHILDEIGACLHECEYFTGSTSYLAEKAAALGKKSFVIHNGLNAIQLELARQGREQRGPRDSIVRIGYFSGTRTHQADFRVVYPSLMLLLRERPEARLRIVGDLDLGEFPGLTPYLDQIETIPLLKWTELPTAMAQIDVNLIPLDLTPFNEGKSNLKYYEAGLLKVPSIASPTRINRESITHGHNGLLARTTEEWNDCLKDLMGDEERRARMGENAFAHVLRYYAPRATAAEAVEVYRQILRHHRSERSAA